MSGTTARLHLPYPGLADGPDGADVPYWMQLLAQALDNAAIDDQGILSNRPTAAIKGRYYFVKGDGTPANNGILWRDNGTTWDAVGTVSPNSVGTTELQDNAVTNAKMADNSVGAAEIIDGSVGTAELAAGAVTGAKVDNTLKPSAGAAAGTEALRALGTGAGTAAAGNDARLSDQRTPPDNTVSTAKIQAGAVTQPKLAVKYDSGQVSVGPGGTYPPDGNGYCGPIPFTTAFAGAPKVILQPVGPSSQVPVLVNVADDPGNGIGTTTSGFYVVSPGGLRVYNWAAVGA